MKEQLDFVIASSGGAPLKKTAIGRSQALDGAPVMVAPERRALEYWYKEKRTLVDFRRGPLGPFFDGFADQLRKRSYTHSSGLQILGKICQFNGYLLECGILNAADIRPSHLDGFIDAYVASSRPIICSESARKTLKGNVWHIYKYLFLKNVISPPEPDPIPKEYIWIMDPFCEYLADEREITPRSVMRYKVNLVKFLEYFKGYTSRSKFEVMTTEFFNRKLIEFMRSERCRDSDVLSNLRVFFHYCAVRRLTRTDLSVIVPVARRYRYASLPKGVEDESLNKVLSIIPRDTPRGLRDYAMMLVMVAYGVRGISISELLLEDIDWEVSTIRFEARKKGKEVIDPLMEAVGQAIVEWLKHRHPNSPHRQVFLSTKAPYSPLSFMAVSAIVGGYFKQAGIHMDGVGARTVRHSWAVRQLGNDTSIKAISDMMGHTSVDTTYIYAKADLKTLKKAAMPWPER